MYTSCASVTRMIISPLGAFIGTPFTSMLTKSSLICSCRGEPRCGAEPLCLDDAAAAVIDHVFELVAVVLDEALHRPRCSVPERTDRVPFDVVCDIDEHCHVLAAPLTCENAFQHPVEPAGALAAWRALTARFGHIKARDALERAHHARGLIHDDDRGGAERRADAAQRVVVH